MQNILILGANSGMARALARQLAAPDVRLLLAGRNTVEMERSAVDLEIRGRGPEALVFAFDAQAVETHAKFLEKVLAAVGTLDAVYLFFGQLHPQQDAEWDFHLAQDMVVSNYLGAVSILERIAAFLETRCAGLIVGVSSVAGDRGRQSNYLYGSSKAALTVYLQGLRNRLARSRVQVLTVKPGFVDTSMTRNIKKSPLFSSPETVAADILRAVKRKKDNVYVPGYWRWIMLVIRMIPERIFKRLKL